MTNTSVLTEEEFLAKDAVLEEKCHLKAYDILNTTANWLQDPENELFGLLEYSDDSLGVIAQASVMAAAVLRKAALDIQLVSGIEDTNKYSSDMSDALDGLQAMADSFDVSDNPELQRTASVLDDILLTIAKNVEFEKNFKKEMEEKIAQIKLQAKSLHGKNVSEPKKKEDKSVKTDKRRPLQDALSTRYFPGQPGVPVYRVEEGVWANALTGEEVSYNEDRLDPYGRIVPGTDIKNQTHDVGVGAQTDFSGTEIASPLKIT